MPLQDEENDTNTQEQTPKLFTCPIDGCVKCFQQYTSLENHLQYGLCKLVPERENRFDKAKISYRDKLLLGCDRHPILASSTLPVLAGENDEKRPLVSMKNKKNTFKKSFCWARRQAIKLRQLLLHKRCGMQGMKVEIGGLP